MPLRVGCPIRRSRDHRSLASPPGFSQRATSFIASQCQGIHQMPLFRARSKGRRAPRLTRGHPHSQPTPRKTAAHRGKPHRLRQRGNPACGRSHEDTSSDGPRTGSHPTGQKPHRTASQRPGPVRLGHIHKFALPFNQHPPRNPGAAGAGHARPAAPEPERNLSSPNASLGDRMPEVRTSKIGSVADLWRRSLTGGGERDRTDDLLLAKQALSQLSYTPAPEDRGQTTEATESSADPGS